MTDKGLSQFEIESLNIDISLNWHSNMASDQLRTCFNEITLEQMLACLDGLNMKQLGPQFHYVCIRSQESVELLDLFQITRHPISTGPRARYDVGHERFF